MGSPGAIVAGEPPAIARSGNTPTLARFGMGRHTRASRGYVLATLRAYAAPFRAVDRSMAGLRLSSVVPSASRVAGMLGAIFQASSEALRKTLIHGRDLRFGEVMSEDFLGRLAALSHADRARLT